VDPGRDWPSPAEKWPAVQEWHGASHRWEQLDQRLCRITKNRLGTVEGSGPSEMVKVPTGIFSITKSGNVGALATWNSFAQIVERKTLDVGDGSGSTSALKEGALVVDGKKSPQKKKE
jgi:hypothetical protein